MCFINVCEADAALNSGGSVSLLCTADIRAINRIDTTILIPLLSFEIVFKVEEETLHRNNTNDLDWWIICMGGKTMMLEV